MIQNQEKLLNEIKNLRNSLPHSILLLGEYGSGHKDICEYIAQLNDLDIFNITEFINKEYIDEINSSLTRSLYYIDLRDIGEREQNILLKLYEEPSDYCYIVINSDSDDDVIDTIKTRSYTLKFERYKKDYLDSLIVNKELSDLILKVCTTPGQIEIANHTNISELFSLCDKIVLSMGSSNFQNMLTIANKINFKDNYDKFDLLLFLKVLKYSLLINNGSTKAYDLINKYSKLIWYMNNKQLYFENMLINLWELMRA